MTDYINNIQANLRSAVSVALVSLPLGIALAVASGVSPIIGVITGIWASIVAAIFGSSNYNIVGAASGLIAVIAPFIANYEGKNSTIALALLAFMSGCFILLIQFFKLEKYLTYIPSSVMYGFSLGIAMVVALGQLAASLGMDKNKLTAGKELGFLAKNLEPLKHLDQVYLPALAVFVFCFGLLFLISKLLPKIPAVVIVAPVGVLIGYIANSMNIKLDTLQSQFGSLEFQLFNLPKITEVNITDFFSPLLFQAAFVVAIIASLETLITAKLADKMTGTKFVAGKELQGLGLANIVSGLVGGLPATGVFLRTGLNIKNGATHKVSQLLSGIFTLVLALLFLPAFNYLPLAVIAAILVKVSLGLIELKELKRYLDFDKANLMVAILVAGITLIEDASIGVLAGVAISLLLFVDKLSKGEFEATFNVKNKIIECTHGNCFNCSSNEVDVIVYSIEGIMAYVDAPKHRENFEKMENMASLKTVIIRMRDLFYLDLDGLDLLEEAVLELRRKSKTVLITAACQQVEIVLHRSSIFEKMYKDGLVFSKTANALYSLGFKDEDLGASQTTKVITAEELAVSG